VTGMRPGEKLFEELAVSEEQITKTLHPKIYIGNIVTYPEERVAEGLSRLGEFARLGDERRIREFMADFLPEACLNGNGHVHVNTNANANGNGNGHVNANGNGNGHVNGNGHAPKTDAARESAAGAQAAH
jgi:hypothetical protein